LLLEKEGEDEERLFVFVSAIEEEETTKDKTQRGTVTSAGMHAQIRQTPWRGRENQCVEGSAAWGKVFLYASNWLPEKGDARGGETTHHFLIVWRRALLIFFSSRVFFDALLIRTQSTTFLISSKVECQKWDWGKARREKEN
jgi:hypothetical protein